MGLGTWSEADSTTIFPFRLPGLAGSKEMIPEVPVAVPLIDSNGASVLKMTLLTPFGSLKSKSCGAASTIEFKPINPRRNAIFFMASILLQHMEKIQVKVEKI